MEYESVGIFANGAPIVTRKPFDHPESLAATAVAERERRVLVRISVGVPLTTVLVDVKSTLYDFGSEEVTSAVFRWHQSHGLPFTRHRSLDTRAIWLQVRTESEDVDALIDVILAACQRTRRWIGGDPSLPHITKEGPPS